jgi:acetyl-CoA acetyltransferase
MSNCDIVIAGYAETPIVHKSGRSAYELGGDALAQLLERTGIASSVIDGLSVSTAFSEAGNPFFAGYMSDALGIVPTWLHLSGVGGCSALSGVARAMSAVREGSCRVALVLSSDAPSTDWRPHYGAFRSEFLDPIGVHGPPATFGLLMSRYAHRFDLKDEALGKIAVTQRCHALANDNACAKFRKPLSLEDYLASRVVAHPLRVLDSVMFCDGANAFLVTTEQSARALGLSRMVRPTAYAEISNFEGRDPVADITRTGFSQIGPRVLRDAGMTPADVRMFQPYDDFTIAVLMQFEAFGFCQAGAGSEFVLQTDLSHRGALPLNTGGGQISAGQPGLASGGLNLAEAVRQMFGEGGERQVADPRNALVTGIGVIPYGRNWGTSAAMLLEH